MAIVIHTIKGNAYAYDHHRVGGRVVCDYLGPVGKGSTKSKYSIRPAAHGGGAPSTREVTQHHKETKDKTVPKAPKNQESSKGEKLHNSTEPKKQKWHASIVQGVNPVEQEKIKAKNRAEYKEKHGDLNRKVGRVARRVDSYETIDNNTIKTQGHTVKYIEGKDGLNIDGNQVSWANVKDHIKLN